MNEFRELCERLLEIPAPVPATSAQMLAEARRSTRRRNRLRLLFSALAVLTVALVVSQATVPERPPPAQPVVWAQMPAPAAVASHSRQAADAVTKAVPAPVLSPSWAMIANDGRTLTLRVFFQTERENGLLTVFFQFAGVPLATDDLCAAESGAPIWGTPLDLCYELWVNDQRIRVAVGPNIIVATRFLRDGSVAVVVRHDESGPGLTPRQVAEIAANPDILPRPVGAKR